MLDVYASGAELRDLLDYWTRSQGDWFSPGPPLIAISGPGFWRCTTGPDPGILPLGNAARRVFWAC